MLYGPPCDIYQVVEDKIWPIAKKWENEIHSQIEEMVKHGIIKESSSPYIILAEKKEGRGKRFCVDFRSLNKKIIKDAIYGFWPGRSCEHALLNAQKFAARVPF